MESPKKVTRVELYHAVEKDNLSISSSHYLTSCMRVFDSWASSDDVWIKMLNKELKYIHDKTFMQQHPSLQPKMRAILLDWLLEVCDLTCHLFFQKLELL